MFASLSIRAMSLIDYKVEGVNTYVVYFFRNFNKELIY